MNLNYINEFLMLAKKSNLNNAAKELSIAPATLSKHMKHLEETLGVQLFTRSKQGTSLTEFGKLFLSYATRMSDVYERYLDATRQENCQNHQRLRIGVFPMMTYYGINSFCKQFLDENQGVSIQYISEETSRLQDLLLQHHIDLAFCREASGKYSDEFARETFAHDSLAAVLSADHPLAKSKSVSLEQLAPYPWLLTSKKSVIHTICVNSFKESGISPNILYSGNGENLLRLISRNAGISILAKHPALQLTGPSFAVVDIQPEITTNINLIYLKTPHLPDALHAFLDFFHKSKPLA